MIGGIVTLAFVVLMLLVGGLLFDTSDWGKPVERSRKPIGKVDMGAYRAFHKRHDVVGEREFLDMIERN